MIDPKELRVGSMIRKPHHTDCGVYWSEFPCTEDFLEVLFAARDYENYEPIPITAEILEEWGFELIMEYSKDPILIEYRHNVFKKISGNLEGNGFFYLELIGETDTQINHLHQLQNLFYALTGEELTANHTAPSQLH